MSIGTRSGCRQLLIDAMQISGKPLPDLRIAEFGNQRIKKELENGLGSMTAAKAFFEWFGAEHVSFDLNGRDGALKINLGNPIYDQLGTPAWGGDWDHFNFVTNFGTSEHVGRYQYFVFSNMHHLCEVGQLMVHGVPSTKCYTRHGFWRYDVEWFIWLTNACGYQIKLLREHKVSDAVQYIHAVLQKTGHPFVMFADWREPVRWTRRMRRRLFDVNTATKPAATAGDDT